MTCFERQLAELECISMTTAFAISLCDKTGDSTDTSSNGTNAGILTALLHNFTACIKDSKLDKKG